LSKKLPLIAACLNGAFWVFVLLQGGLDAPSRSWVFLCVEVLIAFYCYRAFKLAREIRKHAMER
jgi:hypothetical protein